MIVVSPLKKVVLFVFNSPARAVVVPSHSTWFDREQIHELEKTSLPEFFDGKNPQLTPSQLCRFPLRTMLILFLT